MSSVLFGLTITLAPAFSNKLLIPVSEFKITVPELITTSVKFDGAMPQLQLPGKISLCQLGQATYLRQFDFIRQCQIKGKNNIQSQ